MIARLALVALLGGASAAGTACREPRPPPAPPVDQPLAWPALDEATLVTLAATEQYTRGAPEPLVVARDGAVVFRRSGPRDAVGDLHELDATGHTRVLARAAALLAGVPEADRAGAPRGIEAVELSDDGARALVALAGHVFVIERATAAARELAIGANRDPRLSPDGASVAFVRDGDLWVSAVGGAADKPAPIRLTQHPPGREDGLAEDGALGRTRGFWWSPDSSAIAFQRTDATGVAPSYTIDRTAPPFGGAAGRAGVPADDPLHPERAPLDGRAGPTGSAAEARRGLIERRVPRAGQPGPAVELGVVSRRGGAPRWLTWERARYPYLARVIWPARGPLTLVVVNRAQTQLAVLAADPAAATTRPLLIDRDPAWLDVAAEPLRWLPDGASFVWTTEAGGARALERYAADGTKLAAVLAPDAGLVRVVGAAADGELIVEATGDPRSLQVLRVPLAGGAPIALTTGGGIHHAIAGPGAIAIQSSTLAGERTAVVVRGDGARVGLPSLAERPKAPTTTQLEILTLDDHLQDAAVTRPRTVEPGVRYPVVLRIDGEPGVKSVIDADDYQLDQWYADAGFIVVRTDGRGTPGRDRGWARAIAGDVLTLPINDQLGALKQLGARFPELDRGRAGALGVGFGGFLAAVGTMIHPDALAAGVAIAPITDWAELDAAYSERYLRAPETNAEGYRRAAAVSYAEQLTRPLLLVHAETGERFPFAPTLGLIRALSLAGKPVELALLPAHGDLAAELARGKLILGFLRAQLGPPVRPGVMPKARTEEEEEEEEEERARHGGSATAGSATAGSGSTGRR